MAASKGWKPSAKFMKLVAERKKKGLVSESAVHDKVVKERNTAIRHAQRQSISMKEGATEVVKGASIYGRPVTVRKYTGGHLEMHSASRLDETAVTSFKSDSQLIDVKEYYESHKDPAVFSGKTISARPKPKYILASTGHNGG